MAVKKKFRNAVPACVLRKSFQNGVPVRSVTKTPLVITIASALVLPEIRIRDFPSTKQEC
jgi:hypothetical protein